MNQNIQKEDSNKLLKLLGVGFGIAVTVGGTIGTGILRKPGPIAANLGDPPLIMLVWALVSLYAFLGVLCTIELGVSVPRAGAWYVYARRAFGDYVGFVTGITSWLGTVAALGFGAYTMSEYIALVWPNTEPIIRWMAISILIILVGFHWLGTKSAGKSQEIMSFLKAIGLFAFIAMCFIYGGDVQTQDLVTTTQRVAQPALLMGLIIAFQQVFYAFDGWHTAAYFTEENTDPAKNLPKSMISGVLVVIIIYLLVNLAILFIMPIETLATSKLAAADAIRLIFGEKSGKIVTFFLMISILGMLNAQIMFAPRVIYSMSKDGLFFKLAQKVNSGGTPSFAMPLTGICSILLIISGKDTCERLSDIAVFFFVMTYAAGFASVIRLRQKEPNLPRPYKVIGYPYIPFVLIIISILFLVGAVYSDIDSSMYALIFLVLSYPLFLMTKYITL
jgi:APA family basic amino acid/polyamine antiporter